MTNFRGRLSQLAKALFTGVWFACAAAIPVLFLIIVLGDSFPHFGLRRRSIVALALVLSGLVGLFYGSAILNPEKIKTGVQASVRGLVVGLLSYLALYAFFAAPRTWNFNDFLYVLSMLGVIFGVGLIFVGWLILITGTLAGWFLYLLREAFTTRTKTG